MSLFRVFDALSILYGIIAVFVVVRLVRAGRGTFDDQFTLADRRLAGTAAFYLAVPLAVALHEFGHAAASWTLGGGISDFRYMIYWGYVVPHRKPDFQPGEMAFIAAAGNLVSLAIGFGSILWTVWKPYNAAWNYVRLELARIVLGLTLFFYPILSLLLQFGDFWILVRSLNEVEAYSGYVVITLYGLFACSIAWLFRKGSWRTAYARYATPIFDMELAAKKRLATDADDIEAMRDLGRAFLARGDAAAALSTLETASNLRPNDPHLHYLAGVAQLNSSNPRAAAERLRKAGQILEEVEQENRNLPLRYEVTLALAGARLGNGDAEGALMTARAAQELNPREVRGLLMLADALVASGHEREARKNLEAALEDAEGTIAYEIRRRLEALPRT